MRWRAALVAMAVGAGFMPIPPAVVEQLYSTRMYLALQSLLTSCSNRAPIAVLDLLIIGVGLVWIGLSLRDVRRASRSRIGHPATDRRGPSEENGARLVLPPRRRRWDDGPALPGNARRRRDSAVRASLRRGARMEPPCRHSR